MIKKALLVLVISASLFTSSLAILPGKAMAANVPSDCDKNGFLYLPVWYKYLELEAKYNDKNELIDACAIVGPSSTDSLGRVSFDVQKALPRIAVAIAEILLRIAGMVAVGYVIFGGFKYMVSQGEPDALKAAQGTIVNALIGLVIAVLSTVIVTVLGNALW